MTSNGTIPIGLIGKVKEKLKPSSSSSSSSSSSDNEEKAEPPTIEKPALPPNPSTQKPRQRSSSESEKGVRLAAMLPLKEAREVKYSSTSSSSSSSDEKSMSIAPSIASNASRVSMTDRIKKNVGWNRNK